jgi:hypothetical protein
VTHKIIVRGHESCLIIFVRQRRKTMRKLAEFSDYLFQLSTRWHEKFPFWHSRERKKERNFPPFKDFAILIKYKNIESEGILKIMCRKEKQTEKAIFMENLC